MINLNQKNILTTIKRIIELRNIFGNNFRFEYWQALRITNSTT